MPLIDRRLRRGRGNLGTAGGAVNQTGNRLLVAAAFIAAATGCAVTFRDVPRSGQNEVRGYLGAPTRAQAATELDGEPELVWRSSDVRGTIGAPAVGERVTVVATVDRWIYALDTRTGQLYWRYRVRGTLGTGPLISGGLVIIGTQGREGQLAAIDLYTGKRRWNERIGDIASPLVIDGNTIYGATQNGLVFAYSIADGRRRWLTGGAPTRSGPLLVGRHIAVATLRDTLVVLEASTGVRAARAALPVTAVAPLALLDDSTLALSSPSGAVLAIEIPSGRVRWEVDTEAPVYGSPVVARDTVFALSNEGVLWAIPVDDPAGLVKASIGGVSVAAPVILRHGVLVATVDGHVIYFDRVTGRRVWTRRAGGELRHPPIVAQGQIVVAPILGDVLSFR